jgi:hypothetical protein
MLNVVDEFRPGGERIQRRQLNEIAGEHGFGRQHGDDDAKPCG